MPVEVGTRSQIMLSLCLYTESGDPISIPELGTRSQLMLSPCLESGGDRRYMGLCGGLLAQVWPGAGTYFNNTVCQHQSPGACVSGRTNRYSDGQVLRL